MLFIQLRNYYKLELKKMKRLLLSSLLLTSLATAEEMKTDTSFDELLTRTNLSFTMNDGNLNPSIFIPVYYGNKNQFFSGIGYTSGNLKESSAIDNFSDSKNALVSNSKDLLINYISYSTFLFGLKVSVGAQSTFSNIENNEFGYIHDSANLFGNGTDYYIAFDNDIELDVQRHAIRADVLLPFGEYFISRLSTSISPYTKIAVKQSTIFKPLVNETGTSSSSTVQDIAYNFIYEGQIKTGTFFDIGLLASYDNLPLKYDIDQLASSGGNFIFDTTTIDSTEVTTSYVVKILFNKRIIGGLNPSFGYGIKKIDAKDNISGKTVSTDNKIFTIGIEKRF